MRAELHPTYILHHRPYRESSLILECLSSDYGRVGVVARGRARKSKRGRDVTQVFQKYQISWSGRSDLTTLIKMEPQERAFALAGERLYSGFYVNELMMRLTGRHDPNPELFAVYEHTLQALESKSSTVEVTLRRFEKALLDACGYGLELTADALSGKEIDPAQTYSYVLEQGPVLSAGRDDGIAVSGETLLALAGLETWKSAHLAQAKRLMRAVLRTYIGDKPLASRTLFRDPTLPSS